MQIGHSKVFLRRQVFEALECLRKRRLGASAIVIQKTARRFVAQTRYLVACRSAVILQSLVRMLISKRIVSFIREDTAVIKLQCAYRRFSAMSTLRSARMVALFCQSCQRGAVARQLYVILLVDKQALVIQRCWRRHMWQSSYERVRVAVIVLQCFHRHYQARRLYKRLRLEARDLTCVVAERDRFKQEMVKLKREIELLKHSSLPPEYVPEGAVALSIDGSEVEYLRAEVMRLQVALRKHIETFDPGPNDHPPESVFVQSLPSWSLFGAKRDDALSHASSLDNGQSPQQYTRRSHLQTPKKGWSLDIPNVQAESHAATTPLSWPSVVTPGMPSPSASLLDSERHTETTDCQLHSIADAGGAQSSRWAAISPLARNTFEEDPLLVVERRGVEFMQELRCLHASISGNDHHRVSDLLQRAQEPHVLVNEVGDSGRAALHLAVEAMDFKTAKLLIDHGAFVNAQDIAGATPLHLSTDSQMTTLLLRHGNANPNIPNAEGICVLHTAVQRMDTASVRVLLKHHAKVDTADNLRWLTPLHLAALPASGNRPSWGEARATIVELLCGVDAPDLNYQDREGNTPLHYAVQIESQEADSVIRTFLEKGANPRIANSRNQGPLLLLCNNCSLRQYDVFQDCVHSLLIHGSNPNVQSKTGATPLHLCLYNQDIDGAVQVVSRGAELHLSWQKVRTKCDKKGCFYANHNLMCDCSGVSSRRTGFHFGMTWDKQVFLPWTWSWTIILHIVSWLPLRNSHNRHQGVHGVCNARLLLGLMLEPFIAGTVDGTHVDHVVALPCLPTTFPNFLCLMDRLRCVWYAKRFC